MKLRRTKNCANFILCQFYCANFWATLYITKINAGVFANSIIYATTNVFRPLKDKPNTKNMN